MSKTAAVRRNIALIVLASALGLGLGLRVWLALTDDGIYWPDEIYQSLEPAHRLVFGYGWITWEFVEGARSWGLPALVAAVLKGADLVGGSDPALYIRLIRIVFAAIGVGTAWGSYSLARRYGTDRLYAAIAAAFFGLAAPAIYFGPRALSETASALPVVLGLMWALPPHSTRRHRIIGSSLLGIAVLLRLQNGLFCIGACGVLAARRHFRQAAEVTVVLLAWALAYGLLDRLTWGSWFHSAIRYLEFNVIEDGARQSGTAPAWYYLRVMWTSMGGLAIVTLSLALLAARRAADLWLITIGFMLVHSVIPHKEFRFLLPALPLLGTLAAVSLDQIAHHRRGGVRTADLLAIIWLVSATWSGAHWHQLTFGHLGQYGPAASGRSAYDFAGPANRLLFAAYRAPDLCGLKVETAHWALTGGYSYFHRRAPLYANEAGVDPSHFNYVITLGRDQRPQDVRARADHLALVRVRDDCLSDRRYRWVR